MLKSIKTANVMAICLILLLVSGCDAAYENGGGFTQTLGDNPNVKTVQIDGCDYLAFQTYYGYWNYTLKGNGNCGPSAGN